MGRKIRRDKFGRGRTIAGVIEHLETESERLQARRRVKRRQFMTIGVMFTILVVAVIFMAANWQSWFENYSGDKTAVKYSPEVTITDESGVEKIPARTKEYVGQVEHDFGELGYKVVKVVIPKGKSREIDVYLAEQKTYLKLNLEKDSAISAEDAARTLRYLEKQGIKPDYIDVRVEGKAFYR